MLGHHIPAFAVDVQYVFVGLALALSLQHLLARRQDRANAVAFWLAASSAALAGALGANLWLFKAPANQFNLAMFARDALLILAVIVQIPTIAAFAGKAWPKRGVAALVVFALARILLWLTTDLIYAHRTNPNGSPVYGPLLVAFTAPQMLLYIGLVAKLARGWEDRVERWVFLAGFGSGLGLMVASFAAGSSAVAELLTGYWIIPWVVALQVLFARRVLIVEAAARSQARERAITLANLARTERRSRLALRSGGMGWFQYDPATRDLEASVELKAMLGLGPAKSWLTVESALEFFHPDDRPHLRTSLEQTEALGAATAEARWERPDGGTVWVEMSALRTEIDGGECEIVGVVKDVTERKRADAELLYQARNDALTRLVNRASLADQVGEALLRGKRFSLLVMGLDGFKDINDTLGHSVGDDVLVAVARRLATGLREGDVLARFGGDEFGVLVPEASERAKDIARRLLEALHDPVEVDGVAITVRASAGIACAPHDGTDPGTLLRRAESAMYTAKQRDNKIHNYEKGDDRAAARRLQLAGQLPAGIALSEIEVYYQPTIELVEGRCEMLEALVRWHHPQFGLVSPMEFVPLAEQYGLGFQLLRRVLSQALAQCARWREQGLARSVSVNVSASSIADPGFLPCVATELARAGLPCEALVLELTEDAFACEGPGVRDALNELHSIGVRVAIDDFGTGYSSLAYLKQLPVSAVKLDRSFVAGLGSDGSDDAIVALAVELGHHLGLTVIGEGVETAVQLDALRRHGCDVAQGYWVFRPASARAITGWLAANQTGKPVWSSLHLRSVDDQSDGPLCPPTEPAITQSLGEPRPYG
jgi:diguanylate cyclase (GGDEF)-like protein/PAS domain S-box-containing protein